MFYRIIYCCETRASRPCYSDRHRYIHNCDVLWTIDDRAHAGTRTLARAAIIDGFHPYEISGSSVRIYCEQFDRFYLVLFMINPQWYPRDIPGTPKKPPMSRYTTLFFSASLSSPTCINTCAQRTLSTNINSRRDDGSRKKGVLEGNVSREFEYIWRQLGVPFYIIIV